MSYLNRITLLGNITRDPEVHVTPKGTTIANFGIAVNRQWRDESGQQKEEVLFIDCDALGKTGDIAAKYVKKGMLVAIEGRLKFEQWDDKTTGQKRSRHKVVVENIQMLTRKEAGQQDSQQDQAASQPPPRRTPKPTQAATPPALEDDVPF